MMTFDYTASAELFIPKKGKAGLRQPVSYRRFATAAEAIRFAVEDFPAIHTLRAWMRVGDERFNSEDIQPVRQQRLPTAPSHAEAGLKSSRILDLSALDVAMTATLSAYR